MSQSFGNNRISFLDLVWMYKFRLAFYILLVSAVSFAGLYLMGAVPTEFKVLTTASEPVIAATTTPSPATAKPKPAMQTTTAQTGELPIRIIIKKIDVDVSIANPAVADNEVLNSYLLKGAVRYPGSGMLGKGNVFLFGHSSYLAVVNNQAYKAFNDIQLLNPGDIITVYSEKRVYTYKVNSVSLVDSDEALVDLRTTKNILTLSTCNVFGQKQERFVVEADFVDSTDRARL